MIKRMFVFSFTLICLNVFADNDDQAKEVVSFVQNDLETSFSGKPGNKNTSVLIYSSQDHNNLVIEFPEGKSEQYSLEILDLFGMVIEYHEDILTAKLTIDNLISGAYHFKLEGNGKSHTGQFQIK